MKKLILGSGLLLIASFATPALAQHAKHPAPPAGPLSTVSREAATVVDAFHAALERGDTARASALLASDALIFESGRAERSKAEYASHHLAADTAFAKAVRRVVTRRTGHADGRLAWIATETATKGTYKDRPINSTGVETMVLEREGKAWRIKHVHWSSANVK